MQPGKGSTFETGNHGISGPIALPVGEESAWGTIQLRLGRVNHELGKAAGANGRRL